MAALSSSPLELDDSDPTLQRGIELAESDDVQAATRFYSELTARKPNHAGAIYNLGVLCEVQAEYEAAAEHYRRAYRLRRKDLYREALESLEQRLADQRALQHRI